MHNTHKKLLCGLAAVTLGTSGPALSTPDVNPGMWETTVTMEMPGMPITPPPMTTRQCITPESLVPKSEQPDQDCTMSPPEEDGDIITWRVECDHSGMHTVGVGHVTYTGDSMQGTIDMEITGGPSGNMKMTQQLSGRRIGDCQEP
jgi:hypothetical protein